MILEIGKVYTTSDDSLYYQVILEIYYDKVKTRVYEKETDRIILPVHFVSRDTYMQFIKYRNRKIEKGQYLLEGL